MAKVKVEVIAAGLTKPKGGQYAVGDVVSVDEEIAARLIQKGYVKKAPAGKKADG